MGVVGETGAEVPNTGAEAGPFETAFAAKTLRGVGREEVLRGIGRGRLKSNEVAVVGVTDPLLSDSIVVVELEGEGLGGRAGSSSKLKSRGLYKLRT